MKKCYVSQFATKRGALQSFRTNRHKWAATLWRDVRVFQESVGEAYPDLCPFVTRDGSIVWTANSGTHINAWWWDHGGDPGSQLLEEILVKRWLNKQTKQKGQRCKGK